MDSKDSSYSILFVTHTVRMGGANHSMFQLMLELREGYNVNPIVLMPHIPVDAKKWNLSKLCTNQSIEWYSYRYYWFQGRNRFQTVFQYLSNFLLRIPIFLKFRKMAIDAIHSNGSVIDIGAFLSRRKRIPHIWHLREYGDLDFSFYPAFGRIHQKLLYRHADAFIAISETIKNHYKRYIPEERLHLIYNGISTEAIKTQAIHNHDVTNFCVVGRISEGKNQLEAVKAISLLVNDFKIGDIHLYLIGAEDGKYVERMKRFIRRNNSEKYVTFTGEKKDISTIMKDMDVGLMLSKNEAFGRVTVEYQMYNLAVIATNTGANPEIVDDEIDGLLYELGNEKQLAKKMHFLAENRERLVEYATKGMKKALVKFNSSNNTKLVFELYKETIE